MDQQNELRRVNWNEVFSFTHIFKGFRMAIHPSKLLLALAAVVLVYVWGAWILDNLWSAAGQRVRVPTTASRTGEIADFVCQPAPKFDQANESWDKTRLADAKTLLEQTRNERYDLSGFQALAAFESTQFKDAMKEQVKLVTSRPAETPATTAPVEDKETWSQKVSKASEAFDQEVEIIQKVLADSADAAEKRIKASVKEEDKPAALKTLAADELKGQQALTIYKTEFEARVNAIEGEKVFAALLDWEGACITNAIKAVRYGNITGGLAAYRSLLEGRAVPTDRTLAVRKTQELGLDSASRVEQTQMLPGASPVPADDRPGLLFFALMGVQGLAWLVKCHWFYAILLGVFALAVWALFGGAIFRIAALHAAREEKMSMSAALKFSAGKFFSFFTAPLIPLVMILIGGVMLCLGGLVMNIPWLGPILGGLLFFLAIIVGLLIAFATVGLAGGYPLMYPTIAVEGSDSFDAISRSFSYVFARPWRAGLYGLVAVFYGVITFLFVRLFAFIALAATHCFVKWGVFTGGQGLAGNADNLDVMWAAPTLENLRGVINNNAMTSGGQHVGAALIWVWVGIVAALTVAYLLSYCASSTTLIYYLLRRKVDATDLDDVFVEEAEMEPTASGSFPETSGESAAASSPASAPTPAAAPTDKPAGDAPAAGPAAPPADPPPAPEKNQP